MKKLLFLLLVFCPILSFAQLDCSDIGMICDKAQELINNGEYDKALEGLNKAKQLPSLQGCSGMSRIDELIRRIQNRNSEGAAGSNRASTGLDVTLNVSGIPYTMKWVEGGTFTMGATSEQGSDAQDDEKPAHSVTVGDFWIGETEVTQALWQAVMGSNPSNFKGSNRPVEMVSWNDCQTFVNKLNSLLSGQLPAGRQFRLPTEAEWEYAARGGNRNGHYKYSGSNDIGSVAWYDKNSCDLGLGHPDFGTHDVKTKNSNELGIYDMSGNVWEWCQDWCGDYSSGSQTNPTGPSSGSYRVGRGGSWDFFAWNCRVSKRLCINPSLSFNSSGLRVAL